jgi:hypothetical protein
MIAAKPKMFKKNSAIAKKVGR